nr:hypothetical protein [Deltaproteobacteria bacterium]
MTTTQARSFPLVALVLVFAVVAIDARVVIGGKTWSDPRYHVEVAPSRLAAAEIVQGGNWPAWWEGTGLGVPLAAEPTHGAMYPPTWIAATPHALDLVTIAHLAWAAIGMALWARRRLTARGSTGTRSTDARSSGASEPAAVVAALLVISSGLFASLAIRGALPAVAHLPWIGFASAWLADAAERRTRAHATALLGMVIGLVALSGVLAGLLDAIAIAIVIGGRRHSARHLAIAIGAGLAIGLAQWLPALLHLGDAMGVETAGLVRSRLVELIVPGSFGASDADRAVTAVAGDRAWAPSLFVGATLFALAAVRTPARRVLGLVGALATLVLVLGFVGWPWWLGAPEIHLAALVVVLAANAGEGLDALLAGERRAILALGVGGLCTAIALGAFGALRAKHPEAEAAIDRALLDGGLG